MKNSLNMPTQEIILLLANTGRQGVRIPGFLHEVHGETHLL
jgi:hypothetical protein